MDLVDQKIMEQDDKFRAELPDLLRRYPGKWVAYRNGVQHVAEDENTVYGWALDRYGIDGGFVVAQVVEQKPILMTAAMAFMSKPE